MSRRAGTPLGPAAFARSTLGFLWLELRSMAFYPSSFAMEIAQNLVNMGVWFFVARFLSSGADRFVTEYGGSYVAYVVLGVAFHETARIGLNSPYATISAAFWDRRLEGYYKLPYGVPGHLLGRFAWELLFAFVLQLGAVTLVGMLAGVRLAPGARLDVAAAVYALFVLAVFGLGMCGASLFFHLEVKRGAEPVAWLVDIGVRLTSGLYAPLAVVPAFVRPLSRVLPHTYALRSLRLALLSGAGFGAPEVLVDLTALAIYAPLALTLGFLALREGVRNAAADGRLSAVV